MMIKSILKSRLNNTFYKLNFAVTERCNSRCVNCNIWREYKKNRKTKEENELDIHEIEEIFSYRDWETSKVS